MMISLFCSVHFWFNFMQSIRLIKGILDPENVKCYLNDSFPEFLPWWGFYSDTDTEFYHPFVEDILWGSPHLLTMIRSGVHYSFKDFIYKSDENVKY